MTQSLFTIPIRDFLTVEIEDILLTACALNIEYFQQDNTITFRNLTSKDFIALRQLAGVYVDDSQNTNNPSAANH